MKRMFILLISLALGGCVTSIAKTAFDVVTLPVKIVSAGVDAATTSQSEADENRGREIRKTEEQRGRLAREIQERCAKGRALPTDVCQPSLPRTRS